MGAKMIFYKSPKTGVETFDFCPLVKYGCDWCPFNNTCIGEEKEKAVAFQLTRIDDNKYSFHRIA